MKAPILELKDVTVQFDDNVILENINLTIYPGDTLVLIGPSGGGKTVLLKTLAGIYPPTTGHVMCHGRDWQDLSVIGKHELSKQVGMQFQKSALFDAMTAYENVEFPLREHEEAITDKEVEERVIQALKAVGLDKAKNLLPHEMSGGMRQRLGIARAIILNPAILFMDDPTAGLDPINSDEMTNMILNLRDKIKATLVIVTHDILRAYQLAGRIVLVAEKGLIETGTEMDTRNHSDPRVQQFIHGRLEGPLKPT